MFIHLTLVPYVGHAGELKTKPTQHSVNELRRIGIQPHALVCRSEGRLDREIRSKIALFASLPVDAVISAHDVDNIYKVPLVFRAEGVDDLVLDHFGMEAPAPDLAEWEAMVRRADAAEGKVRIALVGKYVQLADAYKSVIEALEHGGFHHGVEVEVELVDSENLDPEKLEGADGILIPGGFGERGIEGKIQAARIARERSIPYLGICLGMQIAVVEFARTVAGMDGANSAEFDPETPFPVVDLLPEQKEVSEMGGTMRLGADPVKLHDGTRAREIYGEAVIYKRHRHRYEVNNQLRRRLEDEGLVCGGTSPDERLVEMIELPDHPFFVASQFHPEFNSRPNRPEPLFREFVGAAARHAGERPADGGELTEAEGSDVGVRQASLSASLSLPRVERLHETFVRLCEIRSPTGEEREVADSVAAELRALGLEVSEDDAAGPGEAPAPATCWRGCRAGRRVGDVLRPPRHRSARGPDRGRAASDGVFRSRGETILGADNKAAVAVFMELVARARRASRRRSGSSCC